MDENEVYTIAIPQSPSEVGEFGLELPVGADILEVNNGLLAVLGNRSNATETRNFVGARKNTSLPSGTLKRLGAYTLSDASRLYVFEIL